MLSLYEILKASKTGVVPDMWTALAAKNWTGTDVKETTGELPLIIKTNGTPLLDYRIYGNMVQNVIPSPENPLQPQECGEMTENMFDCTRIDGIIAGSFINQNGNIIKNNEYYISYPIYVTEEKTYTWRFNADSYNATHTSPTVGFYDASNNLLSVATHNPTVKYFSFTIPNGCKYIRCSVFTRDNAQRQAMLNVGSSPKRYTNFGYKIPISSANTTTPVYLSEVETTRKIKKLVFDGTEEWSEGTSNYYININVSGRGNGIPNSATLSTHTESGVVVNNNGTALFFKKTVFVHSSIADFQAYLAQQYANGTPVTVWYVLAESETAVVNEPIRKIGDYADTLSMEQAGVQIPTNKGNTVIDVETTLKPSQMYIKYQE